MPATRHPRLVAFSSVALLAGILSLAGFVAATCLVAGCPSIAAPVGASGPESGEPEGAPMSPFDDGPGMTNLDPDLRAAVQRAAQAAQDDGFEFFVESGWRSADHQQSLFDDAVAEYGSAAEAKRHVSTPETSNHVTGEAVDIGPTDAMSWLQQHGADYGLCAPYGNEMWHWELLTTSGGECPLQLPDASSG